MKSVCVHGLGYIGLPTAAMLAKCGHKVYGYDVNDELLSNLREGDVHVREPGLEELVVEMIDSGQLQIANEVVSAKYHLICVPTPFDQETKSANLDYIREAGRNIVPKLRDADTVILESTVPPGTTDKILKPILEESGLQAGDGFSLAHSPETVLPGEILNELKKNDRVIGGIDDDSTQAATRLYESFVEGNIRQASGPTTAEFVKLIQNTFRDTNIALANEIAKIARDYGIDAREAIQLGNNHPRVDILRPGPGVGGHCLPIDPWFLGQSSDEFDLIGKAREVNDSMVDYIVDILKDELGVLSKKKVGILGIAYKGNVGDTRMSPGLRLAKALQAIPEKSTPVPDGGVGESPKITLNDPHVVDQTLSLQSIQDVAEKADAIVITTNHNEYSKLDPSMFESAMRTPLVVDTKNILDEKKWRDEGLDIVKI